MKRKFIKKRPIKAAILARLTAKAIDLFIVLILSIFFYPVGVIFALVYISISDSLSLGQSVGKKFMGFGVISLEDGSPCSLRQSVVRNLPLSIPITVAILPIWGWILGLIVGSPLILIELYLLIKLESGARIGDVIADTSVVAIDGENAMGSYKKNKKNSNWFEATPSSQI